MGYACYMDVFTDTMALHKEMTKFINPEIDSSLNRSFEIQMNGSWFRSRPFRTKTIALGMMIMLLLISCNLFTPGSTGQTIPLKVYVLEDGIYTITAKDLKEVGWDFEHLDPARLKVIHLGRDIPIWVVAEGSNITIKFFGQATDNKYTSLNPYFLVYEGEEIDGLGVGYKFLLNADGSEAAGGEIVDNNKNFQKPRDSYISTVHAEENLLYSPQVELGDTWLWGSLTAPQKKDYEITLNNLVDADGKITIELWGRTEAAESPDHHIQVAINDHPISDEMWDGAGWFTIVTDIPGGVLQEGKNTITMEAPGDTGVLVDIILLDWFKIEYPRQFIATDDRSEVGSDGQNNQLSGFSGDISIYDITFPDNVEFIGIFESSKGALVYTGDKDHKYLALGPRGYLSPDNLVPLITDVDLLDPANAADYVAIGPSELLEPINPLLEYRTAQGLQVMSIPVEVIYNHFSHGVPEPEGIRAFLKYVYGNWEKTPEYILLVGDASYDPRGYISDPENNQLPTFFVNTTFGGETASDVLFTQIDDDLLPDIALGRVPAQSTKQVQIFVEKLMAYEQQENEVWQERVLAISDGQDPIFEGEAEAFLNQFSSEYQTNLIAADANSSEGNEQVREGIEIGNLLVSYFGHGSIDMWGKDQLFTVGDAAELSNEDRFPIVLTMSCLNGLFTHPEIESLAEALLWNSKGGAVAALAPTSLTLTTDQTILSQAFADQLSENPGATIGEILLNAQREIPGENPGAVEVLLTFLLFGDPAMNLAYP